MDVYASVSNPIYQTFAIVLTGALLISNNRLLLIIPHVFLLCITIPMKNVEEKWLTNVFGPDNEDYCKRVNRCIPWFKKSE